MRRAFTIVEAMVTVALSATILVLVFGYFTQSVHQFVQGDDTLTAGRHAQLLLSYLKADLALADAGPNRDMTVSPDTGDAFPKHFVHLTQDPESPTLTLFTHTLTFPPRPISGDDPITIKPDTNPATRMALARAAWAQNCMAWIDPGADVPDQPRQFVLNVRNGGTTSRVVYTFDPKGRLVTRQGPEGALPIGAPMIVEFSCSPYLEFIVAKNKKDWPLEFLKCWVEVHIKLQAVQKTDRITKKTIEINTRIVPKYLNASVRGLSLF